MSRVTSATGYTFALTVIVHVAVLLPSSVVTVIVVDPAFRAVTLPLDTVATEVLLLFQLTFLLVALLGLIVAVRVYSSPSVISWEVLSRVTPVTGYTFALTVTSHIAVLPPSSVVTIIIAEPALTAVTLPLDTVATEVLLLFQLTFLLVALLGLIVAVKVNSSPSVIS